MLLKFELNKACEDLMSIENSLSCEENIAKKIDDKYGIVKDKTGHISIHHVKNNHVLWVFFYDTKGIHEAESKNKIVTQKASDVKKYTGIKPTVNDIKKLL